MVIRDNIICGFACVDYIDKPESKNFRRQGVATELSAFIKQDAKEKGFSKLELDVWEFNEAARAFYEAAGFQCCRRYMEYDL